MRLLFVQAVLFTIAAFISFVFLLPNDFKNTHKHYKQCLKENVALSATELNKKCPVPYQ